ncbi:TELO2-interacting protein 2 isoform X2 [Brienomyrus brachyistius]|nr:TELO2-interacting protein 2 isoform X2 [Brienomyrus brachyistius]
MDLPETLYGLQIKEGHGDGDSSPGLQSGRPVPEVLRQIRDSLGDMRSSSEHQPGIVNNIRKLFETGSAHWLFSACCTNADSDMVKVYSDLLDSVTGLAALPLCETESGDLPDSAYADIPRLAAAVCTVLQALISRLGDGPENLHSDRTSTSMRALACALAPPVCMFAVTHLQEQPWTDESSRAAALRLLDTLVHTCGLGSVTQFLCEWNPHGHAGVLGIVLNILKPQMQKDCWKQNQATKHVFAWFLTQVRRPWLVEYLESVFPPSLLISDDYRTENKVLGVCCLHHIVLNVPAADLRQYNRAHVLYHALFNHLYTPEAPLMEVVLPCLLDLLSVLEKPCRSTDAPRRHNRYDKVFQLALTHMEMEHKLALRRVYAHNLAPFIRRMGVVIIRHLKRLERVIVGYLEVSDGPGEQSRLSILNVLEEVLRNAWPRLGCRLGTLSRALLRMMCDVSSEPDMCPPAVRDELLDRATQCLLLLDRSCEGRLKGALQDMDSSSCHPAMLRCIEKVRGAT